MLTLLSEARFWTSRNDVVIKDNDFGAYRYNNKNGLTKNAIQKDGKSDYACRRGLKWNLDNTRPNKLKNCIRKLEAELKEHKIIFCKWKDNCILQLMLSSGLLVHLCVNIQTGDISKIAFDKYFIGKLISDTIVDVIITRLHIIISYNENQITFTYLQKPSMKRSAPEKISRMDPKICTFIIGGPQGRKLGRYLSCNNSFDLLAIWTKSSKNEVYPWRPTVRDQDRANIHIYKFNRIKLELICYHWTEYDPICVEFSKLNHSQFKTVEQKISKKGDVTIENCTYEIVNAAIQRISVTSIPLQMQVCCHALSPDYEKLMLGCIDGSVLLFDEGRGITHHVKAAFIPSLITWHSDSALVIIANERGQFQCFDISLSCVKSQLISEDITPSNVLDLSTYFNYQPTLLQMRWSKKPDLALHNEKFVQTDSVLLLIYENGPIAGLKFLGSAGLKGDIHTSGLTADVLVSKYLFLNHVEKAINILLCLNWDNYGAMCLISLHKIANYIFKHPLNADRELQLQKALGSFHIPVKPLCVETETEFGDQVRDITRKFFFYMLRYKSYEKAFSLAIDINDVDLFMDLYNSSKADGYTDLSFDCFKKAEEIYNRPSSHGSNHSTCSRSSCSICSGSIHSDSDIGENENETIKSQEHNETNRKKNPPALPDFQLTGISSQSNVPNMQKHPPLPKFSSENYVPPLPYFTNSMNSTKLNIPKPELRIASTSSKMQKSIESWNNSPIYSKNISSSSQFLVKSSQANKRNLSKITNPLGQQNPLLTKQSHVVLDVIPKPKLRNVQLIQSANKDREWSNKPPDQTLGIPLTNYHHPSPSIPYSISSNSTGSIYQQPNRTNIAQSFYAAATTSFNDDEPGVSHTSTVPVIHQYPLISGNIPQIKNTHSSDNKHGSSYLLSRHNVPPPNLNKEGIATNSILTKNSNALVIPSIASNSYTRKETGEKNKVKFSDTITVAVVPEIPRKEKHFHGDRIKRTNGFHPLVTDPRRELAESLPLCHPNDDYLKDFNPVADIKIEENVTNSEDGRNPNSSIKVVHFGVV